MILFVIKRFYDYAGTYGVSNGLRTSAGMVVEELQRQNVRAKLVDAVDGNCVDRLVTQYKPSTVVIEALWVTPDKIQELQKLHPSVRWVVRVHSEIPFLANEGISVGWIAGYLKLGIQVGFNSLDTAEDFISTMSADAVGHVHHLPNIYPVRRMVTRTHPKTGHLNVGCFGAIRPLKNQLIQAFAAVRYAESIRRQLVFHMNGTRPEQGGENNLRTISELMKTSGNTLQLHGWLEHEDFLDLVIQMDICLQVSFTESFNIVAADTVSAGTPLVGSGAIRWLPVGSQADPNSTSDITKHMAKSAAYTVANHAALSADSSKAIQTWMWFLGEE